MQPGLRTLKKPCSLATPSRHHHPLPRASLGGKSEGAFRPGATLLAVASTVWSTQARAPAQPPPPPRHRFGREHRKPQACFCINDSAVARIRSANVRYSATDTLPRAREMVVVVAQAEGGEVAAERLWGETGQTGPPRLLSFQPVTGGVSRCPTVTDSSSTAGARGPGQNLPALPWGHFFWGGGSPRLHGEGRGPDALSWAERSCKPHGQEPSASGTTTHRHPVSLPSSVAILQLGPTSRPTLLVLG